MALAGYRTTLKVAGTSTAFTGAATTSLGSNRYQVSDSTKRLLDAGAAVVVRDGAAVVPAANYTVDFLFGTVTLTSAPSGAVTVDASYLPLLTVGEATDTSLSVGREELDVTAFGDTERRFLVGMKDASGTMSGFFLATEDLDAGAGTVALEALHDAGTPKLLEVRFGNADRAFRALVLLPSLGREVTPTELVRARVDWHTSAVQATGRTERVCCGFGNGFG